MSNQPNQTQPSKKAEVEATQPSPTVPRRSAPASGRPPAPPTDQRVGCIRGFFRSPVVIAAMFVVLGLLLLSVLSAAAGWTLGSDEYNATATIDAGLYLLDQYNLAMDDLKSGTLSLAQQRLEFIYAQDNSFLDVHDQLLKLLVSVNSTQQPINLEPTATPTQDPRPKEQLYAAAQQAIEGGDWTTAIDTLLSLRKADPSFHTTDVDDWMYIALRNRGVENITQKGLFEPGLYDFSLAETFGPLDNQAEQYRTWARLYLYGNAYWLAYPLDAAYYYGQLVSLAPDLRDANGIAAFTRYWQSLVQYADQLASKGQWCEAVDAYKDAQDARSDSSLQPTQEYVMLQCLGPSDTPTLIPSSTSTPAGTLTPSVTVAGPSNTPTQTNTAGGPTNTPTPTPTPSSTSASTSAPTATPLPTDTPLPTNTPLPTSTPTT